MARGRSARRGLARPVRESGTAGGQDGQEPAPDGREPAPGRPGLLPWRAGSAGGAGQRVALGLAVQVGDPGLR
jgi:hypothetical protein